MKSVGVVLTSGFIVALAVLLPNFDQIMSLLGALFSFVISGIFPLMCHLKLFKHTMSAKETALTYTLLLIASSLAIMGTIRSLI